MSPYLDCMFVDIGVSLSHFCSHKKPAKSAKFRVRAEPNSIRSFLTVYFC